MSGCFLGIVSLFFLNFGIVLETHTRLCATEPDFPEKIFCPKNWENKPVVGQNQGFLNLFKTFVVNVY